MKNKILIIITIFLSLVSLGQEYYPASPDTLKLRILEQQNNYTQSLTYLYLIENYKALSEKDSIEYYEWEKDNICSFNQSFEDEISYKVWECKEAGGISESVSFPKMNLKITKNFIETLFYDKWNSWVTEFKYEPEGAGCYYLIKQSGNRTTIEIYCGC